MNDRKKCVFQHVQYVLNVCLPCCTKNTERCVHVYLIHPKISWPPKVPDTENS